MPLFRHQYLSPEGELGIWKIEEEETFFLNRMQLTDEEGLELKKILGKGRRLEWLAGRWLLHTMSGREVRGSCYKDEFGKPHLEGSFFEISISHSNKMAAVMAAPRSIGVDIQKVVSKIERIAHKFMREEESGSLVETTRLAHLHVYWGAKEALYKAYGRKELDFKQHLIVSPFEFREEGGNFVATINKGDFNQNFTLEYEYFNEFVLVYGMEDLGDQRMV